MNLARVEFLTPNTRHLHPTPQTPNPKPETLNPKHYLCMGWLRLVGCLKIYVSLQNIGLFCRALLQKRPIFLSILLIVATPYLSAGCSTKDVRTSRG